VGWLSVILAWSGPARAAETTGASPAGALADFARTAAFRAAVNADNVERADVLLGENPDWVQTADLEGDTPLHDAVSKGYPEMALLLLARGARVNATNHSAHTPLHAAALSGEAGVVSLLITNGADLEARCTRQMSPLFEAAEKGHTAVIQALLAHGARPEGWNADGNTALHLAANGGHLEVVRLLFGLGLTVDRTNQLGETPLFVAAAHGQLPVAEWLIEQGADGLAANAAGETALEAADRARYPKVARYLRQHWEQETQHEHDPQLVVAVLPFVNLTGDTNDNHWGQTAPRAVADALAEVSGLRLSPPAAIEFAYRQLRLKAGDPLTPVQIRRAGELVEARRVVWGQYRRADGRWTVEARVTTTATGKTSRRIIARAKDWYDLRDQLADRLVSLFGLRPTPEERAAMRERDTASAEALTWLSQAAAAYMTQQPVAEIEDFVRRALAADPAAWNAQLLLAACLGNAGQLAEAERLVRSVLAQHPESAEPRTILGTAALLQGRVEEAERELREALRLDPSNAAPLDRLGQAHSSRGRAEAAVFCWQRAARLNPWDAAIHSSLAAGFVETRDRDQALRALKEFERLDSDKLNALHMVTSAYAGVGDVPRAVEYGDRFLSRARRFGLNPELVREFEHRVLALRQRLTATPVTVRPPRAYPAQELAQTLAAALSADERRLVVNPLEDTPSMQAWARELAVGAADDAARAQALFDALNGRIQLAPGYGARTAQEVFADWSKPEEVFSCQEFAKLYVALARAVGLEAYLVHLERDYQGRIVYHDCAGVFLQGQCFLADPAYHWFGVPHQSVVVFDDLAVIAHHLQQPRPGEANAARSRAGVKLQPEFAWGQLALARALTDEKRVEEAERALATAQRLEPDRWDYFQVRGFLASSQRRYAEAIQDLTRALEMNPDDGMSHVILADALAEEARLEEAREAFRAGLRCPLRPQVVEAAGRGLATVNEMLGQRAR
jgi:ankyrin repeat protein/tetratricopeptide (TPR) repeat protein